MSRGDRRLIRAQGHGDGLQERGLANGFAQVSDAAGLLGLLANFRRVMRGDEDDRRKGAQLAESSQQVQAGNAAELNVENQTVRLRGRRRSEECLGRGVSVDFKSRGAEQPAERACKTVVIIHDADINFVFAHPNGTRSRNSAMTIGGRGESAYCPLVQYTGNSERRLVALESDESGN